MLTDYPLRCKAQSSWCDWTPAARSPASPAPPGLTGQCTTKKKMLTPANFAEDQSSTVECAQWSDSKADCKIREFWCAWNGKRPACTNLRGVDAEGGGQ